MNESNMPPEPPENYPTREESMSAIPDTPVERRRKMIFAASIVGLLGIAALAMVLWTFSSDSGEGRPVPAPRTASGDTSAETITNSTLTLSPEQVQNAGIKIETVGEQLSAESGATASTGVVEANAYRQTPAVTLVGGIVRRVVPELGQNVTAGRTVAVIFSDEFAQTQSRYVALRTEVENARRNYERTQRLIPINPPGRTELEQATKQRVAAEAGLREMRSRYERTTNLVRIGAASREELEQDTTKVRTAEAEVAEARLREQRARAVLPISPEVRAANEEALNKLRTAETEQAAVRQRLVLYGMPAGRVDALRSASQIRAELEVPAPISGTVTGRSVNPGEVVEANKELLRITDLSTVWVIAQVYERDLGQVRVGTGASVIAQAFPDALFRGRVTYIDPQLDEATRTAKVRVEVANPNRDLSFGMFVNVAFGSTGMAERTSPVVPAAAVQSINNQQIVFVATADPNVFELRPVNLAPESNGLYPVLTGINVGDRVVTEGSFLLRAEWLKTQQSGPNP